jgi:hypothetical protein
VNDQLPAPLVPADVDLRGLDYMPLFGNHLFGSEFNAMASDEAWRAGVTLWWAAWNQQPAGSLPDNDVALCRLADLGRDVRGWKQIRDVALRGFTLCSDGRLYHPFLCKQALIAWDKRVKERDRKAEYRAKKAAEKAGQSADVPRDKPGTKPGTDTGTGEGRDADVRADGNGRDVTGRDVTSKPKPPEAARINPISPSVAQTEAAVARDSIPPPDPSKSPTRRGAVAVILRSGGVSDATQAHPTVVDWAQRGVTDQQLRDAIEIARTRKPSGDIPVAYLKPIVTELHERPVDAGGSKERDWDFIFGLKERA